MNDKVITLIVAVVAIIIVGFMSDSRASIQQTLSLIAFILLFHYYLQRHLTDVTDITTDIQNKFKKVFRLGEPLLKCKVNLPEQVTVVKLQDHYKSTKSLISQPLIIKDPIQEYNDFCINNRFKERPLLTYQFETNRIDQQQQRFRPNKDVKAQQKMLKNQQFWKDEFSPELQAQESQIWFEQTDDTCQ